MALNTKTKELGQQLVHALANSEGVRLGESTVISRRVHVVSIDKPEEVRVVGADAGQVFYGRHKSNEIYHVDVFHQVGRVDHRALAGAIMNAVNKEQGVASTAILDRMDIQTATGGGRLTGSLTFGRKASLRRAHANHVHLAAELNFDQVPLLIPIVAAVEEEVVEQGLEIRKVERVSLDLHQSTGSKADLSAYSSDSDSLLREDTKSSDAKPSGAYGGAELKEAHQLATKTMPPAELLQLLRQFPFEPKDEHRKRWGDLDHTLEILKSKGFIKRKRGRWMLTDKGQSLLGVFARHLPELESRLRRFLRHFPLSGSHSHARISTKPGIGWKRLREKKEVAPYTPEGRLNLAATVARAGCRWVGGHIPPGTIGQSDLLYSKPLERRTFSILLVVDCSASMAGDRLRAARMLAQHLVLATRGKVAVIAFQEDEVLVPPMFTSSLAKIQAQLLALKATGLTPMAKALAETHTFLMQRRVQKPLVVLITDGIPTVPLKGNDASSDALEQAEKLKGLLSQFVCIGLNPNQTFMEELCRRSGGQLYIVKELEPGVLAKVVHQELRRRRVVSRNNCNK